MPVRVWLVALAFGVAAGALAPTAADARWSDEVAREMMSPYCPGRTLMDCPSPQAAELILWLSAQEEGGRSREDVEAELFRAFGDELRQAPRPSGMGLAAYLVPAAAAVAGGVVVALFLRRQRRGRALAPPLAPVDPELERLVDDELGARAQSSSRP